MEKKSTIFHFLGRTRHKINVLWQSHAIMVASLPVTACHHRRKSRKRAKFLRRFQTKKNENSECHYCQNCTEMAKRTKYKLGYGNLPTRNEFTIVWSSVKFDNSGNGFWHFICSGKYLFDFWRKYCVFFLKLNEFSNCSDYFDGMWFGLS